MLFANVNVLTMDEARRILGNIAKPPKLTYPIRRHGPKGAHAHEVCGCSRAHLIRCSGGKGFPPLSPA